MAAVMRSACDDVTLPSTCEDPQFPSWAWRYNRNKHLSRYEPWYIREERMPPNYRNMGVHSDFRFHPLASHERPRPFQMLGVNFCHEANTTSRRAGFGNSAIGRTPGPAPPRLILYPVQAPYERDDLYKVNEIHNLSAGVSLIGPQTIAMNDSEERNMPLNPSHYLEQTLGQTAQIPGTFPHFNKPLPILSHNPPRKCPSAREAPRNPMEVWKKNFVRQQARHVREANCLTSRTTYNMMNDWMRLQGRVANAAAPVVYTGMDGFKEMPSVELANTDNVLSKEDSEEKFQRSYSDLAHQIAYRYPNPGLPRIRQGAIGGTWRHIKEVLGHHGSRVCFVDGLVSVYDTSRFSEALQPPLPYKGKLVQPPFAPSKDEFEAGRKCVTRASGNTNVCFIGNAL